MLEREGKTIGVPKGILCLHWYDVYLEGKANQVGPTPMEGRNDALVAAAEMILEVRALPEKMGGNMVATVGEIQNYPNSRNIIPDRVHFTVDIRTWDDDLALRSWDERQGRLRGHRGQTRLPHAHRGDLARAAQSLRPRTGRTGREDGRRTWATQLCPWSAAQATMRATWRCSARRP